MRRANRVLIIGGGFFGLYIAEHFAKKGFKVRVLEREAECMQRASFINQARVHNGYHYPRSVLTALRSRISFPKFSSEFPECIKSDFEKYYLIGKILGKVTARQFQRFCDRIGASCEASPKWINDLIDPRLVEAVYHTQETAFDAIKLRELMLARLLDGNIELLTKRSAKTLMRRGNDLVVGVEHVNGTEEAYSADQVFNCTYSMLNCLETSDSVGPIPLKHQLTELCLVEPPGLLANVGITVMCGPFFSFMPFPSEGLHSFSHVRYTPHAEWYENVKPKEGVFPYTIFDKAQKKSAWNAIRYDARRYMPILDQCTYKRSIWEIKTLLPKSEKDDSRPILFMPNHGESGYHCIIGGKIDNVYDAIDVIHKLKLDQ